MRIFKGIILFILIVAVFSSGSLNLITRGVDKTVNFAGKVYSDLETFALKMSQVTEVQYEEYYLLEPEFDSAFKSLNYNQQEIYKMLYAISLEMPEGFVKLYKQYDGINRDVAIAYNALLYDRVEIFWMPYTYILSEYSYNGKLYTAIAFSHDGKNGSTDYKVSKSEREGMQEKLDSAIEKILTDTKALESEYKIEKYFNDYICANTEYVTEGGLVSTAYGALIEKKAHCEGYSRAFKLLCNKVGIECDLVCGISFDEGHMWNVVNIDGAHSYVDVTWNDRTDYESYLYFNVTEEQMKFDHELSPLHTRLSTEEIAKGSFNFVEREATYTGNTYYEKNQCVLPLTYAEKAAAKIKENFKKGETHTEFLFTSKITLSEFQKGNLEFIATIQEHLDDIKIESYIFERDVLALFYE